MPIIKSAKKRVRQNAVKKVRNEKFKRSLREEIKTLDKAIADGKKAEAAKQLPKVYSAIDTALKKNLIHKNKAARKKSQLNSRVKALVGAKSTVAKPSAKATAKKPAKK